MLKSEATARRWVGSVTGRGDSWHGRQLETSKNSGVNGGARSPELKISEGDWAVHIFREHNKEADAGADKGARGLVDVDFAWSHVTGICVGSGTVVAEPLDVEACG